MGGGHWSDDAFRTVSSARAHTAPKDVFRATTMHDDINPGKMKMEMRESRDSADHPYSHAIIVGFDVTGSMGKIPHFFAKEALGVLMQHLLDKKPVPDPQLLVAAVGDATCDRYPLQVGQFESDNRVDQWLTKIVLEGGGGGQDRESYGLVHHFAGMHTSIDCFEKRGQRGFLFTVGDEKPCEHMAAAEMGRVFGYPEPQDVALTRAIRSAERLYDVIHVIVKSHSYTPAQNIDDWRRHLGQNVLVLEDYLALAELIIATIGLRAGMTADAAMKGFGAASTALVSTSGVLSLQPRATTGGDIAVL